MATKTLLEIVQDILNDMDSDEVNSINDTVEALQVAQIIQTTYEDITTHRDWPHLHIITNLTASSDADKPTHMTVNTAVMYVEWVKYNVRKATDTKDTFIDMTWMEPKDFVDMLNTRNSSADNIKSVTDDNGVTLLILDDTAPAYYTSFDDETLVLDAYDTEVDTTLQGSKSQIGIYKEAAFSLTDAFIPDLPSKAFPYLVAEAKSVAFNALKQAVNQKEEQRSRRQRTYLAREKWRNNGATKAPSYGR